MYDFCFGNPVKAFVGRGKSLAVTGDIECDRVMLMGDPVVSTLPQYGMLKDALGPRLCAEFTDITPNPHYQTVDAAAAVLGESEADTLIAIGGGSVLDAAKTVACLGPAGGTARDYLTGAKKISGRNTPLYLMPTTAGTGSEMTNVAVITDPDSHKKVPLVSDALYCDIAVIDPDLTRSMPFRVAASSGFDALCHAIEALWNLAATPPSDALAMQAIDKCLGFLEPACNGDPGAGEEMAIASYLAGLAFNQTRTTVCHAISYSLTATYGIDHGTACTFTLVPFLQYNLECVRSKLDAAAALAGLGDAVGLIDTIADLYVRLKMPARLSQYGVGSHDIWTVADEAMAVGSTKLTPRTVTREALADILHSIL